MRDSMATIKDLLQNANGPQFKALMEIITRRSNATIDDVPEALVQSIMRYQRGPPPVSPITGTRVRKTKICSDLTDEITNKMNEYLEQSRSDGLERGFGSCFNEAGILKIVSECMGDSCHIDSSKVGKCEGRLDMFFHTHPSKKVKIVGGQLVYSVGSSQPSEGDIGAAIQQQYKNMCIGSTHYNRIQCYGIPEELIEESKSTMKLFEEYNQLVEKLGIRDKPFITHLDVSYENFLKLRDTNNKLTADNQKLQYNVSYLYSRIHMGLEPERTCDVIL